jgi:hypothetical protein
MARRSLCEGGSNPFSTYFEGIYQFACWLTGMKDYHKGFFPYFIYIDNIIIIFYDLNEKTALKNT